MRWQLPLNRKPSQKRSTSSPHPANPGLEQLGTGDAGRGEQLLERLISEIRKRRIRKGNSRLVYAALRQSRTDVQPLHALVSQSAAAKTGINFRLRASARTRSSMRLAITLRSILCRGARWSRHHSIREAAYGRARLVTILRRPCYHYFMVSQPMPCFLAPGRGNLCIRVSSIDLGTGFAAVPPPATCSVKGRI